MENVFVLFCIFTLLLSKTGAPTQRSAHSWVKAWTKLFGWAVMLVGQTWTNAHSFIQSWYGKMKKKIVLRCAAPTDILKTLTRVENSSEAASSLLSSSPSSHSVRARTPAGTCPHSSNRPHRSPTPDCRATGGHTETLAVSVDSGEHLRKFAVCRYSDKGRQACHDTL